MHHSPFTSLVALGSILAAATSTAYQLPSTHSSSVSDETYDYIVVGGGPSGIIAAERIAETNKKVLLLERGTGPTVSTGANKTLSWNDTLTPIDVPGLSTALSDVGLYSEYVCDDTAGTAACVLGGGCTINYMVFVHPQEADFNDKWPQGWKWSDVEPAANRLYERNPGTSLPSADGKRYDYGIYSILSGFLDSVGWKAVDQVANPNEKYQAYSYPVWNVKDEKRAGPLRTYLPLAQQSKSFTLRTGVKVNRVVRTGSTATGVEIQTANGTSIIQLAPNGRVVLAAGAMGSPHVLFNSGIGPQAEIAKAQSAGMTVPAQKDWISLPVGAGIKDHPIFLINVQSNGTFSLLNTTSVVAGTDTADIDLYEEQDSGILTQGRHRVVFWTSNVASDNVTRFYQGSVGATTSEGVISITAYMTHGLTSSGTLVLNDAGNATVFETVPYLQTAGDREAATDFIQQMVDYYNNPAANFSIQGYTNVSAILDSYTAGIHFVGSNKLGTDDGRLANGTSVVDTNAKVYGMDNLYIVDASIHPDLPTGNAQAIVMVVAEAAIAKILSA
ncbi:hypothetical protein BP5796_04421 [Coleophoma crateriformis]|uniref:Glucose-methanol-choline oxidoreductase N-terminal domain-containing protein n=1 Tax=Coleophoma crateriformis TaxID=565419 RepID=A0A3D8S9K2_9HELO|nr:hypothetical protein BP5796_04421 [Coleophoma crateriformis]